MGAGLYPPPSTPKAGGVVYYANVGATSYVGDTETRAYLAVFNPSPSRLYKITANLTSVDTDAVGDQPNTTDAVVRYAKNSAIIRARYAWGTDATVADTDIGYRLATVYHDDSMTSSGTTCHWFIGCGPSLPNPSIAVCISLRAYRAAGTYGSIRILTGGGSSNNIIVEDIGPYPVINAG
ncbi:hypothetical protein [Streptomyces phage phiScoe45]|nr:hypothetical protein [Streptomyces phage phiScoe45]